MAIYYGQGGTVQIMLFDSNGDFIDNPTIAAGDFKVLDPNGTESNLDNDPSGTAGHPWVDVQISAAESKQFTVLVHGSDAAGDQWENVGVSIPVTVPGGDLVCDQGVHRQRAV